MDLSHSRWLEGSTCLITEAEQLHDLLVLLVVLELPLPERRLPQRGFFVQPSVHVAKNGISRGSRQSREEWRASHVDMSMICRYLLVISYMRKAIRDYLAELEVSLQPAESKCSEVICKCLFLVFGVHIHPFRRVIV